MTTMTSEMEGLKMRLKATWMAGDYGHFATYLEPGALEFLARRASKRAHARLQPSILYTFSGEEQ